MSPEWKAKLKNFAKRSARRLLWIGLVLAVFYGIENWRGNRYFDDHVASLKSRGESLKLEEVFPPAKALSDEDNAALAPVFDCFYIKDSATGVRRWAVDDLKSIPNDLPLTQRQAIADWNELHATIKLLPCNSCSSSELADAIQSARKRYGKRGEHNLDGQEVFPRHEIPSDGESPQAIIAKFYEPHAAILNGLKLAGQQAGCVWPEMGGMIYQPQRGLIGLHCLKALSSACLLALSQNNSEEAFMLYKALICFATSERTHGSYFSCVIRISRLSMISKFLMAGISAPSWTELQLTEIQKLLPEVDVAVGLLEELREGRARLAVRWNSSIWLEEETQNMTCGEWWAGFMTLFYKYGPRGWHQRNRVLHSEMTQRRIDFIRAGKPLSQLNSLGFPDQGSFYNLFALDNGSEKSTSVESAQTLDAFSLCSVAIGLQRCKISMGEFPKSLDQLVPTFLPALPKSYFDGRTPSYRIEPNGQFKLWYFGIDGDDDGGRSEYDEGERRYPKNDCDLVFLSSPP